MTPEEYIRLANRTAPVDYPYFTARLVHPDIVHAWLGVTTETGESGDVIKKAMIYGASPDLVNLDEEFGDKLWYIALYCFRRNISFSDLFTQNIEKLKLRFPDKYSDQAALERDTIAERRVLEAYSKDDGADAQTILTREYIRLNNTSPTEGSQVTYNYITWQYNGTIWEVPSYTGPGTPPSTRTGVR